MTNSYFDTPNYTPLSRLTTARAEAVDTILTAIVAGFALLPAPADLLKQTVTFVATDTGLANAYVISQPYSPTTYTDGMEIIFRPANTNTGASTVNVNAIGLANVFDYAGNAVAAGALLGGGIIVARYDSTAVGFKILSPNVTNTGTVTVNNKTQNSSADTTPGYLSLKQTALTNGGLVRSTLNSGANEQNQLGLDFTNLAVTTNISASDRFAIYDATATAMKYQTRANVVGKFGLVVQASSATVNPVVAGNLYPVDCTSGTGSVTFPASASANDIFGLVKFGTNAMTVNTNSLNYYGTSYASLGVADEGMTLFFYTGASRGWIDL